MRKRMFTLILSAALALSLTACGEPTQTPIEGGGSGAVSQSEPQPAETAVTITPDTVLMDEGGLVITAKEFVVDELWGPGVKVLVENKSDKNLSVSCNSMSVNGYMVSDLLFVSNVAAGKKANETLFFSQDDLKKAGITTVADVRVSFHVYDSDSYSGVCDTDEIQLKTSAFGTVEQPAKDDGKELYNQNGVRIVGKYVEEDSFWGAGVLLFMENTTDQDVIIQCDDMSINGFMVDPLFSSTVNDHRMALSEITVLSGDLEANGIQSVDEVELTFRIMKASNYHTIAETGPVSFTTK